MSDYFADAIKAKEDSLEHHGVLGQKWGVRRFQDKSGHLTTEGKAHYNTDKGINNVGRALVNGTLGQRIAVGLNKGYRKDRKEIKEAYKKEKEKIDKNDKEALKSLKNDYKLTKQEARVETAKANYSWQSDETNKKIQTQSTGKAILKDILVGNAGSLAYDTLTSEGVDKGTAVMTAIIANVGDYAVAGLGTPAYYAYKKHQTVKAENETKPQSVATKTQKEALREVEKAKRAWVDYQAQDPEEHSNLYSQQLAKDYQDKKRAYDEKYKKN